MSTQIDLGPVLSVPKGDWDANTTYERLNLVRHNSAAWICNVATSIGVEPTEDSTDWYLQVKDTSSVTSVNGMKGDVVITLTETETPPANDNSNRIATTEWVTDKLGDVDLSGIKDDTVLAAINASGSDDGTGDMSIADVIAYIDKSKGMKSVGDLWFGFDAKSKPAGVLLYAGEEVSRGAYGDHWNFISNGNRTIITEIEWQAQVAADGFCPYFSSGDGSTTYRMPLVKGVHPKFVAALAEAGQHIKAGAPNIGGKFGRLARNLSAQIGYPQSEGALYWESSNISEEHNSNSTSKSPSGFIVLDASLANPIYGNADTIQPPALTCLIGEWVVGSVATLGEADAESLLAGQTLLDSKVGALQNGSGFSVAGKAEIVGWGMPDYTAGVELTLPSSTQRTYVCPTDGVLVYNMLGFNRTWARLIVNDVEIAATSSPNNAVYWPLNGYLPVQKGDVVKYIATNNTDFNKMVFYPLRGA